MPSAISQPSPARAYRPRNAAASPLYRIMQDHLETFLVQDRKSPGVRAVPAVEDSMRAFLECGIHRFGVVRFRCGRCAESVFVPWSCKRRMSCPTCDSKRAAAESSAAMDGLLPRVPYRQCVLVLPKRLRYFVHRNPALAGEISRILASAINRFYAERSGRGGDPSSSCAPAQVLVVQRFGGKANLHVHLHAVVSDGVFALPEGLGATGKLQFIPAPEPSPVEIAHLCERLRRSILRRVVRLGAVPEESAREMLARPHGGFSLDASVRVAADDRPALERLIRYCLRPAISLKRLTYLSETGLVRYRPIKTRPGEPAVLEWEAVEFLRRFSRIIAPPRLHLIRYAGALGPRHTLRPWVTHAARQSVSYQDLLAGAGRTPAGIQAVAAKACKALGAAARSWAAAMRKVFEIDPVLCPACGAEMKPVAAITRDCELERLLRNIGLPTDFPRPSLPAPRRRRRTMRRRRTRGRSCGKALMRVRSRTGPRPEGASPAGVPASRTVGLPRGGRSSLDGPRPGSAAASSPPKHTVGRPRSGFSRQQGVRGGGK